MRKVQSEPEIFYHDGKYIIHFLGLLTDNEHYSSQWDNIPFGAIDAKYNFAIKKANDLRGKIYHNKSFGGGISFDSNFVTIEQIVELSKKETL